MKECRNNVYKENFGINRPKKKASYEEARCVHGLPGLSTDCTKLTQNDRQAFSVAGVSAAAASKKH